MGWRDQTWTVHHRPLIPAGEGAGLDHPYNVETVAHFEGAADMIRGQTRPTIWLLTPTLTKSRTAWTLHEGQPLRLPDAPNKNGSMTAMRHWGPVVDIVRWWGDPKTNPVMMFYTALRNMDRPELRRLYQGLHARAMDQLLTGTQQELAPIAQGLAGALGDQKDPIIQRALTYTLFLEKERSHRGWAEFLALLLRNDAVAVSRDPDSVLRRLPGALRNEEVLAGALRELVSVDTMFAAYIRRAVNQRDRQRDRQRAKSAKKKQQQSAWASAEDEGP